MNKIRKPQRQMRTIMLLLLSLLVPILGCNGKIENPETVAVQGKVLLPNGSPLTGGTLVLAPETGLFGASAQIQPDGTFALQDSAGRDVAAGKYQVFVRFNDPAHDALRKVVNERYQQSSEDGESDVIVEIPPTTEELVIRLNR